MKLETYIENISNQKDLLIKLLSRRSLSIAHIRREKPSSFNVKGVYIISKPDDQDIVYAGKTNTKTIIGRISDHMTANTKSDLKIMLNDFRGYPKDAEDYMVRCVEINDMRERAFFEHFVIGALRPMFNK